VDRSADDTSPVGHGYRSSGSPLNSGVKSAPDGRATWRTSRPPPLVLVVPGLRADSEARLSMRRPRRGRHRTHVPILGDRSGTGMGHSPHRGRRWDFRE
jgi:hypothetical protein